MSPSLRTSLDTIDFVLILTGVNSTETTALLPTLTNMTLVFFQDSFAENDDVALADLDIALNNTNVRYLADSSSRYLDNEVYISIRFYLETTSILSYSLLQSIVKDIVLMSTDDYITRVQRYVSSDITKGEFQFLLDMTPSIGPTTVPSLSGAPSTTPSEIPSAGKTVTTAQTMAAVAGGAAAAASSAAASSSAAAAAGGGGGGGSGGGDAGSAAAPDQQRTASESISSGSNEQQSELSSSSLNENDDAQQKITQLVSKQVINESFKKHKERKASMQRAFRAKQIVFRGCVLCAISSIKLESRFIRDLRDQGLSYEQLKEIGKTKNWKLKLQAKLERKKESLERKAIDSLRRTGVIKNIKSAG